MAYLAVECGIAPCHLVNEDETMLRAMVDYIAWRANRQSGRRRVS